MTTPLRAATVEEPAPGWNFTAWKFLYFIYCRFIAEKKEMMTEIIPTKF